MLMQKQKASSIYMSKAQDAYVYDIDGNRFIDLIMAMEHLFLDITIRNSMN